MGAKKDRENEWLGLLAGACDQIEQAADFYPELKGRAHGLVMARVLAIFGSRKWTRKNVDSQVLEILNDALLKDVPSELLNHVYQAVTDEIDVRRAATAKA
jgi:hypothetical protein